MTTRYSAPRYLLGEIVGGRTYIFTGLPTFRSGLEAADYWRSKQRNGSAYIFEERDAFRLGVNYGTMRECVAGPVAL